MSAAPLSLDTPPVAALLDACGQFGNREAIVAGARRVAFGELGDAVLALAGALRAAGLAAGERVAMWLSNSPEMIIASFAIEAAGGVRVPLNPRYTAAQAARVLADCEPRFVLLDREPPPLPDGATAVAVRGATWQAWLSHPPLADCPAALPEPDMLCSLNYTSGSSGEPKGVMLSHRNWAAVCRNLQLDRDIRGDDRLVHIGPLSHASGAYVLPFLLAGAPSIIVPPARGIDALPEIIAAERGTVLSCVPTVIARLVAHPRLAGYDLASLRQVAWGGEPLPPATLRAAHARLGPVLVGNYGLTEAMMTCCTLRADEHFENGEPRAGAIGRPYREVEIVLRDTRGEPVADGETGELTVRGAQLMQGYWRRDSATAAAIRHGWLYSGDLARRDADGIIRLAGRRDDMLISGGFNIHPQEVAGVLACCPGVAEAAVVGRPDPDWGEIAVACVVAPGLDVRALVEFAKPRLGIKTPKRWLLLDALPRAASGKVDRAALRRAALAEDGHGG